MLKASEGSGASQLWAVVSTFHMGEYVKSILDERHINGASVARAMEIETTSFPSYFRSKVISDDVLMRMSNALKFDLLSMVKEEQARRSSGPAIGQYSTNVVQEPPAVPYGLKAGRTAGQGMVLTLNLDEFPEDVQLQLIRYVQQLPRKGSGHRSALG